MDLVISLKKIRILHYLRIMVLEVVIFITSKNYHSHFMIFFEYEIKVT